jgi:hypothetical protein
MKKKMKQQRILKLLEERRTTTAERLENAGYENIGITPEGHITYCNGTVRIFYDDKRDKVLRGELVRR